MIRRNVLGVLILPFYLLYDEHTSHPSILLKSSKSLCPHELSAVVPVLVVEFYQLFTTSNLSFSIHTALEN